jgi:cellulose biosynthesis protein BcsQ
MLKYVQDTQSEPSLDVLTERHPWEDLQAHVGITHRPTLAPMPRSDQYRGAFWNGRAVDLFNEDLGSDQANAGARFRMLLAEWEKAAVSDLVICLGGPADGTTTRSAALAGEVILIPAQGQDWPYRITETIVQRVGELGRAAQYEGPTL